MTSRLPLYHGTNADSAAALCQNGWEPGSRPSGGQCGDPKYLYLTNHPENALWYAEQKGDRAVLAVEVPVADLIVDPHDGVGETIEEELAFQHGIPGSVCLIRAISAEAFRIHEVEPSRETPSPLTPGDFHVPLFQETL